MKPQKRTTKTGAIRWVARYRDATGKEHSKSFDTQREAKAFLQEQERAVRRNEWIAPTDLTVLDLVKERVRQATNDSTRNGRRFLQANLGELAGMRVQAVKPADIRAWLDTLTTGRPWADGQPLAVTTIKTCGAILHGIFTEAVEEDVISRHPMRGVKMPAAEVAVERSEIVTASEVAAVIQVAESTGVGRAPNLTLAAMIQVAAETGLRAGELCGLRVRNVNFLRGEIAVVEQMHQRTHEFAPLKTRASRRVVPVGTETMGVIEEQLQRQPRAPHETVFATSRGEPFTSSSLGVQFRKAARAAGVDMTFHGLRHFYASSLIENGASVVVVQRAMGHASAAMTLNIYSHLFPGAGEELRGYLPVVRDFSGISGVVDDGGEGVGAGQGRL